VSDRHKHPDYSETYVRDLRDQRDDWRRIAQTLGYNEAGAEWLEPWCDEHPDLDGQGCVATARLQGEWFAPAPELLERVRYMGGDFEDWS
jgi:hypothetical protein